MIPMLLGYRGRTTPTFTRQFNRTHLHPPLDTNHGQSPTPTASLQATPPPTTTHGAIFHVAEQIQRFEMTTVRQMWPFRTPLT